MDFGAKPLTLPPEESDNFLDMTWADKAMMNYWREQIRGAKTKKDRRTVYDKMERELEPSSVSSVSNPLGFQNFWKLVDPEFQEELRRFQEMKRKTQPLGTR
jgi:hypothetical protein